MSGVIDLTSDDDDVREIQPSTGIGAISDEEDEDLKLAIALSLQDQASLGGMDETMKEPTKPSQPIAESSTSSSTQAGLLGLDRKAMEAERLARLKRKREPEPSVQPSSQLSSVSTRISPPPRRKHKAASTQSSSIPLHSTSTKTAPPSFRTPQVLLTSDPSRRDPKDPSKYTSISFADIISPPSVNLTLKSTLLSSFIADFDWILPRFNTRTTNFLLILHAQSAQHRTLLEGDFAGLPNVKLVIPEVMGGAGNMHSKVMLLFYTSLSQSQSGSGGSNEEICRVVIPSANLTRADWGVGGVMENILFVVDLPLKTGDNNTIHRFEKKLKAQLAAMKVSESVLRKLDRFNFGSTQHVEFVYSNSGSNLLDMGSSMKEVTKAGTSDFFQRRTRVDQAGRQADMHGVQSPSVKDGTDDAARTGLLSLNDAVMSSGLDISVDDVNNLPQVDFITSSLGNLTTEFVRQLYLAICGRLDPAKIVAKPKRSNTKLADTDAALDQAILQNLKIYFPSSETVHRSKGGPGAGGTICFQRKWWDSNDLIRKCLHDCVGVRGDGILMHSKILYVRSRTPRVVHGCDGHDRLYAGWAYVGSANLSESAWGRIVGDAKSRQPKLTCRNWESGILLPMEMGNAVQTGTLKDRAAAGMPSQLGKACEESGKSISTRVNLGNASGAGGHVAPTSLKKVVTQVDAGKSDNAVCSRSSALGESDVYGKDKMACVTSANMQQDGMYNVREVPSLGKVFSERIPVPIRHPARGHVASQQIPWFFME